jgi:GntR family transcriptional regulator
MLMSLRVDKQSHIPIYIQLSDQIRSAIQRGEIAIADQLPSETELARRFAVSPMTVRHGLQILVHEGVLQRERGKGTFVRQQPVMHQLERLNSFTEDLRERGMVPESAILDFRTVVPPEAARVNLQLRENEEARYVKRLRRADGVAVGVHEAFVRSEIDIDKDELDTVGSLYELLARKGVVITGGRETIEACSAPDEVAELLGLARGAAVMRIIRTTSDVGGRPVEYVIAHYRGDLYRYSVQLSR